MQGEDSDGQGAAQNPRLFLSYTRADIARARPIIARLEQAGFDVWWDGLIEGGDHYLPTTEAALEGADCVVVLWSNISVDSTWVRDEAQRGRERGRLVPVSLDGTMSPLGFRQLQLIDISSWNGKADAEELSRIVTAIHRLIDPDRAGAAGALPSVPVVPPAKGVSRRTLMFAGTGLAIVAGGLGVWQSGVFGGGDSDGVMSLAVLRFVNLTGDEEKGWFSDGLSNELRQVLSRNPRLRVSAPTSSRGTGEEDDFAIAKALGVSTILRGSVQRAAETTRIFVELVEAEGGIVRWSESYDRAFDDVLAVQSEIAQTVALSLVTEVANEDTARRSLEDQAEVGGTEVIAAYEAYLRGAELANLSAGPDSDRAALALFETAIAADPGYAAAHAKRATMLAAIANVASDAEEARTLFEQSIAAASRAIELEPQFANGHRILGFALSYGRLDLKAARPHYLRADELAPGDADTQLDVALFYAYGTQRERALEIVDDVLILDPLNAHAFRRASIIALLAHDFEAAVAHAAKALEFNRSLASANYFLGVARFMRKDVTGAMAAFDAEPVALFRLVGLAITHAAAGNQSAAQSAFDDMLDQYGDAGLYQQAQVFAQWGRKDDALATLARAFEMRDPGVLWALNDPLLDPLRGKPQLDQLLLPVTT